MRFLLCKAEMRALVPLHCKVSAPFDETLGLEGAAAGAAKEIDAERLNSLQSPSMARCARTSWKIQPTILAAAPEPRGGWRGWCSNIPHPCRAPTLQ